MLHTEDLEVIHGTASPKINIRFNFSTLISIESTRQINSAVEPELLAGAGILKFRLRVKIN
jgi:hypothetical protein